MTNPFFKNYGPIKLKDIYKTLDIKNDSKTKISDIKDLNSALNFLVVSENSLEDLLISSVKSAI